MNEFSQSVVCHLSNLTAEGKIQWTLSEEGDALSCLGPYAVSLSRSRDSYRLDMTVRAESGSFFHLLTVDQLDGDLVEEVKSQLSNSPSYYLLI